MKTDRESCVTSFVLQDQESGSGITPSSVSFFGSTNEMCSKKIKVDRKIEKSLPKSHRNLIDFSVKNSMGTNDYEKTCSNENTFCQKEEVLLKHKECASKSACNNLNPKKMNSSNPLSEMDKFHKEVRKQIMQCTVCFEAWPINATSRKIDMSPYVCARCVRDTGTPKKFSSENGMIPSKVPPELQDMTQCEEMLIARAFPVMQVYIMSKYGTIKYKGHVVTLPHNVQKVADVLPHLPKDIPVVSFCAKGRDRKIQSFRVRKEKILKALLWLKNNNVLYKNISIDMTRINTLPDDDFVEIPTIMLNENVETDIAYDCGREDNENLSNQSERSSFVLSGNAPQLKQRDVKWYLKAMKLI